METIMISTILVNICIGCFACVGLTTAISMIPVSYTHLTCRRS